ncbi:hAT family dimerization domain-containing protein, partial [Methanobrevibacter sp.]
AIAVRVKRCKQWKDKLDEIQMNIYGTTLSPVLDVKTRWFSSYDLMRRIYQISGELNGMLEAIADELEIDEKDEFIAEYILSDEELEIIAFFIDTLQIILEKSKILSSETEPTMSMLIPCYKSALRRLEKKKRLIGRRGKHVMIRGHIISTAKSTFNSFMEMEEKNIDFKEIVDIEQKNDVYDKTDVKTEFIDKLTMALQTKFENDYNILTNECCILATIVNPEYKFDYVYGGDLQKMKDRIEEIWKEDELNRRREMMAASSTTEGGANIFGDGSVAQLNDETDVDDDDMFDDDGREKKAEEIDELDCYMKEPCIQNMSLQKILEYWESNKNRFPKLYTLSKRYLPMICTSCSSERLFSKASGYMTNRRSRMLPSHLEELCICQSWLNSEGSNSLDGISFQN